MKPLKILHLYPDRMNIYGDFGNIITLCKRMEWRGVDYDYTPHYTGEKLSGKYDIIFMGGGQDKGQEYAAKDLQLQSRIMHDHFKDNTSILTICGGYQLFGNYFITANNEQIQGINLFNVVTKATEYRMIGNIVIENELFGKMVGFENHSGSTVLEKGLRPLGKVVKGYGNNREDDTEGVWTHNAIGTYLHGSFLPKNPKVADYLIEKALQRQVHDYSLSPLGDELEMQAASIAQKLS